MAWRRRQKTVASLQDLRPKEIAIDSRVVGAGRSVGRSVCVEGGGGASEAPVDVDVS